MANGLLLGGGAPTLTLEAGALAALHDKDVRFDVISTAGAGMLVRSGITVLKYWFSVSFEEQRKRFEARNAEPL